MKLYEQYLMHLNEFELGSGTMESMEELMKLSSNELAKRAHYIQTHQRSLMATRKGGASDPEYYRKNIMPLTKRIKNHLDASKAVAEKERLASIQQRRATRGITA